MSDLLMTRDGAGTKRTAAAIASPGNAMAQVIDILSDGICIMDEEFHITYANRVARRISHIRDEDLNGRTHWELYPETLGTAVEETYRNVMSSRHARVLNAFYYPPFNTWYQIHCLPAPQGIALHYRDVTEQRRSEEKRRESDDRVRLALNAANGIGIWDWDVAKDSVYADTRFATVYGVDPERAAQGVPLAEFTRNILQEDIVSVRPAIEAAVRDGSEFSSQYRILQADGSTVWVSARGRCTHDEAGKPLRFIGAIVDITDQKQNEHALVESETRYRVLTELSPQSQWSADPNGRVLYANQRFLEYLGTANSNGSEFFRHIDPRDRDRAKTAWSACIASGDHFNIDVRLIRGSDGEARWWNVRALPVRDEDGTVKQWLGSATDVHEERLAARKLREQYAEIDRQRRELETIYGGSPIGMALYEPKELRLVRINDRQAEIFRIPAIQAIGRTYDELAAGVPLAHSLIRRAAQGEHILNHEVEGTLDRWPGEHRYWSINYSPIFNEDGTVRAIASATFETTHQKRAELALIQSEKLAAVGRMASSIAHEINNPLESVTNLIFIARQHASLPEVQHFLDLADQELRRVAIIANQTLRFHKQASFPREVKTEDLFATVLRIYEGRLRNSGIHVEQRNHAARPVRCFEGDIRQVLNNLVGNAIDAMPKGGRLLTRSREGIDFPTGRAGVVLTVADTGAGMSTETIAKVFEPFFTTKGINGTGLGLWISSEIVGRHEGRLLLRSSAGRGTVFSLFLPFEGSGSKKSSSPESVPQEEVAVQIDDLISHNLLEYRTS